MPYSLLLVSLPYTTVSKIYKFQVGKRKPFIHTDTKYDVNMYTGGGGRGRGGGNKGQPV
jgi:hypothetical protein